MSGNVSRAGSTWNHHGQAGAGGHVSQGSNGGDGMSDLLTTLRARRRAGRKILWTPLVSIVAAIAMLAASAGMAFGNAANPLNDSSGQGVVSGTIVNNPDGSIKVVTGTVKVDVGGTWDWGELSNSTPQDSCKNR